MSRKVICEVDKSGKFRCEGDDIVTCSTTKRDGCVDYVFEFENGYAIVIKNWCQQEYWDAFGTISFELLGHRETFTRALVFTVRIEVIHCGIMYLVGSIYTKRVYSLSEEDKWHKLGDFKLKPDGTVYKGQLQNVVYDRKHYAKELLLNA